MSISPMAATATGLSIVGLAAGITGGVLWERSTHNRLERENGSIDAHMSLGNEWIADANKHFGSEINSDRLRSRELDAKIEDYVLEHPMPDGVHYSRNSVWYSRVDEPARPRRDGMWLGTGFGGVAAAGIGIGVLTAAVQERSMLAAGIGAALLGIGVGALGGALVSNGTH